MRRIRNRVLPGVTREMRRAARRRLRWKPLRLCGCGMCVSRGLA